MERVQHTLNVYLRILQPEEWAQWARNQADEFDAGAITNSQTFMNSAVQKYNKIMEKRGDFKGSTTSLQEDIVAMLATKRTKTTSTTTAAKKRKTTSQDKDEPPSALPPFIKHYKHVVNGKDVKYKVGD